MASNEIETMDYKKQTFLTDESYRPHKNKSTGIPAAACTAPGAQPTVFPPAGLCLISVP